MQQKGKNRSAHEKALFAQAAPNRLTRRTFLGAAAASVVALVAGSVPVPVTAQKGSSTGGSGGGGTTTTRYPLHIPPPASPSNLALRAAPGVADLGDGKNSSVLAYNGFFPGPTLRANKGDSANISFTNGLSEQTTVHWHGMIVPTVADGHPLNAVAPGAGYSYQFPIAQRACLNWYHPHPHMLTGKQVCLGLAGAFIVNDTEEATLGLPSGAYEVPLIVRDANLDKGGNLTYNPTTTGFDGKIPLVNGTRNPKLDVDTALYRFRVLNGANARLFKLALSNGAPFTLIGNDGGLLGCVDIWGKVFPTQDTNAPYVNGTII